jgi:hypothetical protein
MIGTFLSPFLFYFILTKKSYTEEENAFITGCLERMGIAREMCVEILNIHHKCLCNAYW